MIAKTAAVLLVVLLSSGCRVTGGRWVEDDARRCPGGVINSERRVVDSWVGGRVRTTTTRTDACVN
jgi:hypothetical protein